MRHTLEASTEPLSPAMNLVPFPGKKEIFRERFRCAIEQCVRHGFQVEECFGVIWEETLEEVEIPFREQNELFPELIRWAKRWVMQGDHLSEVIGRSRQILPSMRHG
jgi:hypothetical protein